MSNSISLNQVKPAAKPIATPRRKSWFYATVLTTSALPLASSEVGGLLRIPSGFEGFPRAVVKPR